MKNLQFKIEINSPASNVYSKMLGLENIKTYNQWTTAFNPSSTYKGNWEKGSKIHFIGTDENGKLGGMVSEIKDNIPNQFVSIRHYGILDGENEITEGPEVEKWANGLENYSFEDTEGKTTLTVNVDVTEDFVDFFNEVFPKALERLKNICES